MPEASDKTKNMKTKSLRATIIDLMEHPSNTNQTGLTLSPAGWGLTFQREDLRGGEVMVISKDSFHDWADGHEWDDHQYTLAAEYVTDNIGDWLRELDFDQREALLAHV